MARRFTSCTFVSTNTNGLLTTQPLVLMNRFIINLRSLSTAGLSQSSSARQSGSRFSALNFRGALDSLLGNIGEDLQDGHEPADGNHEEDHGMDAVSLNTRSSPEAGLEETTITHASSGLGPIVNAQVSIQIHAGSKSCERTPFHLGWPPGRSLRLWNTS